MCIAGTSYSACYTTPLLPSSRTAPFSLISQWLGPSWVALPACSRSEGKYLIDCVVLLLLFALLIFLLLALKLVLDLPPCTKSLCLQFLKLSNSLPQLLFLDDILDQFLVLLGGVEPGKDLHEVMNLLLLLGPGLVQPHLLPNVQQLPRNNKLLALDSLSQLVVVNIYQPELHRLFLL